MVSADAEAEKYFSLLSAFSMTISGSIESFSLCNWGYRLVCTENTLHLTWAGEVHVLSLSGANAGGWEKRSRCMFFQAIERLEMKEISLFLCCIRPCEIFVGFCAHLSHALLGPKVNSARFPLEERVRGELLVTQILHQEEFSGGSGLPSSSPGLA